MLKAESPISLDSEALHAPRRTLEFAELADYAEAVLAAVDQVPAGRVVTYGAIASYVGAGGARQVGHVMALHGGSVTWWRVVRADGRPATGLEGEAMARLVAEGAPMRGERVDLPRARWVFAASESTDENTDENTD